MRNPLKQLFLSWLLLAGLLVGPVNGAPVYHADGSRSSLSTRGLDASTQANLPNCGSDTLNELRVVTDGIRGVWKCNGTAWISVTGHADVRDFGATGNGVTDNSTAIQTAITAALVNTNPVYIPRPPNFYRMGTTGLTVGSGLHIHGDGSSSTSLVWDAGFSGTALTITGNYNNIEGFLIAAPKTVAAPPTTAIGIDLQGPLNELHDISVGQTSAGNNSPWHYTVKVTGIGNSIYDSHLYSYHTGVWSSGASGLTIQGTEITVQSSAGVHWGSASQLRVIDSDIQGVGSYGVEVFVSQESGSVVIGGTYFEGITNTAIYLGGSSAQSIRGIEIAGNTINTTAATNGIFATYTNGLNVVGNYIKAGSNAIWLSDQNLSYNAIPNYIGSGSISKTGTNTAAMQVFGSGWRFHGQGTALVAGDFALSAGWGTTATVSAISGTDQRFRFTVTSAGTGQGINPTATLTFKDGTWTAAPFAVCSRNGGLQLAVLPTWTTTATTLVITFPGTPVATETYTFECVVMG